jgi:hypothetical protein
MKTDKIDDIERRLRLIEAFLDVEMQQRQLIMQSNHPNFGPPIINHWYGSSMALLPTDFQPGEQ